jgi:hypothetical protein
MRQTAKSLVIAVIALITLHLEVLKTTARVEARPAQSKTGILLLAHGGS